LRPGLIDEPLPLVPLKRISPSRFGQLRGCALQEIWRAGGAHILLPRYPAAILGTLAHQILKEAGQGVGQDPFDAAHRWEQLVDGMNQELKQSWLEATLAPLETSARMYEVLRLRACTRAGQIVLASGKRSSSSTTAVAGTGFELWVESHDKSVGGWIDAVRRTKDGIVLSDFKSGEVLERPEGIPQNQLKESHRIQVKLYAALYFQTYGIWPITIQIVPLAGAKLVVPFTNEECGQLLDEAAVTLKSLNSLIAAGGPSIYEALGTPSPQNCRFCSYRPGCPAYRKAHSRDRQADGWPVDAFGKVWDINVLRDGGVNLRTSGARGEQLTFRALSSVSQRHPALQSIQRGDHVGIFNARPSSNRVEFAEGPLTVLYKIPATPPMKHIS
jgi:hypothetical protein